MWPWTGERWIDHEEVSGGEYGVGGDVRAQCAFGVVGFGRNDVISGMVSRWVINPEWYDVSNGTHRGTVIGRY